jgi:pyruvate/2-oxoacid:ferredoxin oxidoreductase alpha subunit
LVSLQVDSDVDVLVALALKFEFAKVGLLRSRVLRPFPLDLREVVRL